MKPFPDGFSDSEREALTRLLPYWGLTHDDRIGELTGTLSKKSVTVSGLSGGLSEQLSQLLQHTGVQIRAKSNKSDLDISVEIHKNTSAPIALRSKKLSYYLKPLRKQTEDVQTWIHKRLWLPINEQSLLLVFHAGDEKNIPEWLSYLIVQYFMQPAFQPLSNVPYLSYQQLVNTVLKPINSVFATCQLTLGQSGQEEWPELPPGQEMAEQSMKPFLHNNGSDDGEPFNPFRNTPAKPKSTINPFRKKSGR